MGFTVTSIGAICECFMDLRSQLSVQVEFKMLGYWIRGVVGCPRLRAPV